MSVMEFNMNSDSLHLSTAPTELLGRFSKETNWILHHVNWNVSLIRCITLTCPIEAARNQLPDKGAANRQGRLLGVHVTGNSAQTNFWTRWKMIKKLKLQ